MKKIYSIIALVAMLSTSMCMFTSCGDDEIDEPKKEEPKPEEPKPETVDVYCLAYGANLLDIYDVTLSFYRNGKKQDVVLSTEISQKAHNSLLAFDEYRYYRASVNGEAGVDSVVAAVTTKPNLEAIIASQDKSTDCNVTCDADIKRINKVDNGDYSDYCFATQIYSIRWDELTQVIEGNKYPSYEYLRTLMEGILSGK